MLFVVVLCLSLAVSAFAVSGAEIYDEADLLSSAEETQIAEKLSKIGEQFDAQIVIMTVPTSDGSIDTFVEDVYDSMNMGCGENRDGVLLLVCMDPREYRILSNGYAGEAIGMDQIDAISEAIVSNLSDGDYADAFITFADNCAYYLDGYLNGYPFNAGKNLVVALIIGVVAGVIVAFVLKKQLKSVRQQKQANVYIKSGSMQITASRDLFLYREVSKTKKASTNSSGSGSSRNVGGGKF
jgi:uncharacterized protein